MKNIVISGIHFPVTAAIEYITRAFKRRLDCNIKTVGPYPGLHIPWTKNGVAGMVLPEKYDFKPDIPLPYNGFNQSAPIGYIEKQLGDFKVDLWLDVNAGFYLEGQPENGIRATFLTDPHVMREWYDSIKHNYKIVFCPQTPYAKQGEIYLPYAADIEWHTRIPDQEIIYDVSLIGNTYPNRVELMNNLKNMGIRTFFELGPAKDDAQLIYSQSLMGINWSSLQDLTARVFELCSLGVIPILNRVPDLPGLFDEGVHYLGFDTIEQAIARVREVADNPEDALKIAKNAREAIITDKHTWDDRVQTILEVCELL